LKHDVGVSGDGEKNRLIEELLYAGAQLSHGPDAPGA
jgi:hypothetical protein